MITIKTTKTLDREFDISAIFDNEIFEIQYEKNVFGMSELDAVVTFILSSVFSGIAYDILKIGVKTLYNKMTSKGVNVIIKFTDLSFFKISDEQIVLIDEGNEKHLKDINEMFSILESKIKKS